MEISFSPFNIGDCVSPVARMTTQMVVYCPTDIEWDEKMPTEDDMLPGSDHPQSPYI